MREAGNKKSETERASHTARQVHGASLRNPMGITFECITTAQTHLHTGVEGRTKVLYRQMHGCPAADPKALSKANRGGYRNIGSSGVERAREQRQTYEKAGQGAATARLRAAARDRGWLIRPMLLVFSGPPCVVVPATERLPQGHTGTG